MHAHRESLQKTLTLHPSSYPRRIEKLHLSLALSNKSHQKTNAKPEDRKGRRTHRPKKKNAQAKAESGLKI